MPTYQIGNLSGQVFVNCLLKGTLVKVDATTWVPIESLTVGNSVLTPQGKQVKILEISHDLVVWEEQQPIENKILFKIPAGKLGASSDTFLTFWHKILHQEGEFAGQWRTAAASRIPKAKKEEISPANTDSYSLYNLRLEDDEPFVVNGGAIVESWSGKQARVQPLFSSLE